VSAPAISVVVPAYGRAEPLSGLLGALAAQEAPDGGFEVIVVDDGSPVPLGPALEAGAPGLDLRVLRRPNRGPAAARNAGAGAARGALLAFTDDDCLPEPGWLRALQAAAAAHPGALVGGANRTALDGNPWAEASQALEDAAASRAGERAPDLLFVPSKNLAVDAAAFAAAGGFDERFRYAEDREFCWRWLAQGRAIVPAPAALVRHANPAGPGRLWRQHVGYGRGAFHFHRARAAGGAGGLRPDARDYAAFAREPFRGRGHGGVPRLSILAIIGLTQVATVVGYAREAAADRRGAPRPAAPAANEALS
jgi:glycosyltransferase involved in cell wall biosynthesis